MACLLGAFPVAAQALRVPENESRTTVGGTISSGKQGAPKKESIRVIGDRRHVTKGPASRNVIIMLDSSEKRPGPDQPQDKRQ